MVLKTELAHNAMAMRGKSFDTTKVAPEARTRAWCNAVQSLHFSMSFDAKDEAPYRAAFKSFATDDFSLVSFDEDGCSFHRRPEHVRDDPSTDIELVTPLFGSCEVEQFGIRAECKVGQFVLFDANAQFQIVQPERMSALMFKISRWEAERRLSDIEAFCGKPFPCVAGLPRLAFDLLRSIERESERLNPSEFQSSCGQFLDLLAMGMAYGDFITMPESLARQATYRRIKSYLHDNAFDPELSTAVIAQQLGISERYIQALFQENGTTVREYVGGLRLGRARELLSSALHKRKSITQIAYECGFPSSAYFSTKFRASTDMTPSEYREAFASAN